MRKLSTDELGRHSVEEHLHLPKRPITLVLDNIRSGLNVGSIFRSADAFRIRDIWLCGITPQPPHRDILKAALGSTRSVTWHYQADVSAALEYLQSQHYQIIGVEQTTKSIPLRQWAPSPQAGSLAIVLGNELHGLSEKALPWLNFAVEIPQEGVKHSLNVAVCAGIVLWHLSAFYELS